ncbi:PD-(D/E)XK nuclease family protein [Spirosoma oryzicola]|uniref:PD-(D/E)XK nuclease family protein n=1 Tax=Spirosoma oryzicola TaxID=2898794 RepID=UPI001E3E30D2|nr:PD-(D/E)XK nuclease family protein [Spirosoma oryzicola]UHG94676.1 PD-(D/E)XK nuclease family protein [Spirosoma oryzicola]
MRWTYTESNTFRQCRRKFYFSQLLANFHYTSPLRRKAFELGNAQDFKMWQGSVVDKILAQRIIPSLKENGEFNIEQFAEEAVSLAKAQFTFSEQGHYKTNTKSSVGAEYCVLNVHELMEDYSTEKLEEVYTTIRKAILNLPNILMPDGEPLLDYLGRAYFLLPDVSKRGVWIEKAWVCPQIDLLAYIDYKPVVIDWKVSVSETSDYSRQLMIIGLVLYRERNFKMISRKPYHYNDIRLLEVNLIKGKVREHTLTQERANEILDEIYLTSEDIRCLTRDRPFRDLPITDFGVNEFGGYICDTCPFYSLCSFMNLNNNKYDEQAYTQYVRDCQCA